MTRTVRDAVLILDVIAGPDTADPVTLASRGRVPAGGYVAHLRADGLVGKRLGVVRQLSNTETADAKVLERFEQALADLRRAGATVIDVQIPELDTITGSVACASFKIRLQCAISRTSAISAPVKTVEEIIESRKFHPSAGPRLEGYQRFTNPQDDRRCQEAARNVPRLQAGVRRVMAAERLDASSIRPGAIPRG